MADPTPQQALEAFLAEDEAYKEAEEQLTQNRRHETALSNKATVLYHRRREARDALTKLLGLTVCEG